MFAIIVGSEPVVPHLEKKRAHGKQSQGSTVVRRRVVFLVEGQNKKHGNDDEALIQHECLVSVVTLPNVSSVRLDEFRNAVNREMC